MTKLDEFRSWLYSHREEKMEYGFLDEGAVDEIIDQFETKFADELKAEDEVVEES